MLFVFVFAEQIGLPIPAVPVLLAMGALAGTGQFSFWMAVLLATMAAFLADCIWYDLGRRRGTAILRLLCRISLEPDSCVSSTKNIFGKLGAGALLFAKFIPGLSTMAPPMAGLTRMNFVRFAGADGLGTLLWVGGFIGIGYAFHRQLERMAEMAERFGSSVAFTIAIALIGYLGLKYWQRQRFMRSLRVARITPEELRERLHRDRDELMIVDLRSKFEQESGRIPGALLLGFDELDERHAEIPRDRDIVLYCT